MKLKNLKRKKKKNLDNYKNLAKLQEIIDGNKRNINLQKKKNSKVQNGYYIGKNLSKSSSRSTILDQNELLKNLIESKQIILSGNRESDNEDMKMSKEEFYKLLKEKENKMKTGAFSLESRNNSFEEDNVKISDLNNIDIEDNNNEKKKNNNKNKNSLIQKAEESIKKTYDIMKKNNLNDHLYDHNKNNKKNNHQNNSSNKNNQIKKNNNQNIDDKNIKQSKNQIKEISSLDSKNKNLETKSNTLTQTSLQQSNINSINPEMKKLKIQKKII